ncbi:CD276 antigen-like [Ambystoma mexicanum]|uniref:CD276 antigen-like n=1 Tax=Ambystoma mexicanum TaxID=8296 RepID=UPI0037E72E5F
MESLFWGLFVLWLVSSADSAIHKKEAERIQALYDQTVSLPCFVPSLQNAEWFSLYWFRRQDGVSRLVNVYRSSLYSFTPIAEVPSNRTQLCPRRMRDGNASLRIQHVRVSDAGMYTCFALVNNLTIVIQDVMLEVSAPYSRPEITVSRLGPIFLMKCSSHGGYPEASVQWHDGKRQFFDTLNTLQVQNRLGLYELQSHMLLEPPRDQMVCCSISNKLLLSINTVCTKLSVIHKLSSWGSCPLLQGVLFLLIVVWLISLLRGWRRKHSESRTLDVSVLQDMRKS